jgi:hypothetical protein
MKGVIDHLMVPDASRRPLRVAPESDLTARNAAVAARRIAEATKTPLGLQTGTIPRTHLSGVGGLAAIGAFSHPALHVASGKGAGAVERGGLEILDQPSFSLPLMRRLRVCWGRVSRVFGRKITSGKR